MPLPHQRLLSRIIKDTGLRSFKDLLKTLILVLDLAEEDKMSHAYRVSLLSLQLGVYLKCPTESLRNIFYAGLLHDVGIIGLREDSPPLEEYEAPTSSIRKHPRVGAEIVSKIPTLDQASSFIAHHHEWWNGQGYPNGVKGEDIPLESSIISVCDTYDAFLFLKYQGDEKSTLKELERRRGVQLHPDITRQFVKMLGEKERWSPENFKEEIWARDLKLDLMDMAYLSKTPVDYLEVTLEAFARVIDNKHRYTHGHSIRVAVLSEMIAHMMGFSSAFCQQVRFSALLHDAGKVGIPCALLDKPGVLTPEEYEIVKRHPVRSAEIIHLIPNLGLEIELGARHHHEQYGGGGYPNGLGGTDIPLISRVIAVADTYDAMTTDRAYRLHCGYERAKEEILYYRGIQHDPEVVDAFLLLGMESITKNLKEAFPIS